MAGSTLILLLKNGGSNPAAPFDPCTAHYRSAPESSCGGRTVTEESPGTRGSPEESVTYRTRPEEC